MQAFVIVNQTTFGNGRARLPRWHEHTDRR